MIQSRKWKENISGLHIYYKYIFQIHPNSNPESRQKGLTRWQTNPEKNWGPKARAKRQNQENDGSNQGKRAKRRKVTIHVLPGAQSQWHLDDLFFALDEDLYNSLTAAHTYVIQNTEAKELNEEEKTDPA